MLGGLAQWTINVIEKGSYLGLGALVAIESIFPPIPSEVVLPMAGFLTGQGRLNYFIAIGAATVGSVVGALVLYELGRRVGDERLHSFARKHGKWLLMCEGDLDKAAGWFERHRDKAVFIGRFAPGVRSFVSIPAGIQRMNLGKFILYTAAGSGIYNAVLIGLGWIFGQNWEKVSEYTGVLETVVWVVLAAIVGYWIWKRKGRKCPEQQGA